MSALDKAWCRYCRQKWSTENIAAECRGYPGEHSWVVPVVEVLTTINRQRTAAWWVQDKVGCEHVERFAVALRAEFSEDENA